MFKKDQRFYPRANKEDNGKNFQRRTRIDGRNSRFLEVIAENKPFDTDGGGSVWTSLTSDKNYVYGVTHTTPELNGGGYVMRWHKDTLELDWRIPFSNLSGVDGDAGRAAPTIYGDRLYVATSVFNPQTWAPYTDVVRRFQVDEDGNPVPYPSYGKGKGLYCLDKNTGALIWESILTNTATSFYDEDNCAIFTQQPVVVDVDYKDENGHVNERPIVLLGSSSIQSFVPWFASPNNNPFGPGINNRQPNIKMTERGRIFFVDAITGDLLHTLNLTPDRLKTGDEVPSSALRPGMDYVQSYHWVRPGDLNPISRKYSGDQNITWRLDANGSNTIPSPLDGLSVVDKDGNTVTLVSNTVITNNLNGLVVNIDAYFNDGTTNFVVNGTTYQTTDPLTQLDGTSGLDKARINVYHRVGDILESDPNDPFFDEAYRLNYYGVSCWGSSMAVRKNRRGKGLEFYVGTGQNHSMPPDENLSIVDQTRPILESLNDIAQAQSDYRVNPSQSNLNIIRNRYLENLDLLDQQLEVPKSERGYQNYVDSILSIDLRPGHLGEIIDVYRTMATDVWHVGLRFDAYRQYLPPPLTQQLGVITDVQQYHGFNLGYDNDSGEGPHLIRRGSDGSLDKLIQPTKGGFMIELEISDQEDGPGHFTEITKKIIGNPGNLGGSNMGSCSNIKHIFTIQVNDGEVGNFDFPFQTGEKGSVNPQAQNFMPKLDWYPLTSDYPEIQPFPLGQSYISAYNFRREEVDYEVKASPQNESAPWITTTSVPVCTNNMLAYNDGEGYLHILRSRNGREVKSFNFETGGMTSPLIEKDAMYTFSGRVNLNVQFPLSNYVNAQKIYKLGLPSCRRRHH